MEKQWREKAGIQRLRLWEMEMVRVSFCVIDGWKPHVSEKKKIKFFALNVASRLFYVYALNCDQTFSKWEWRLLGHYFYLYLICMHVWMCCLSEVRGCHQVLPALLHSLSCYSFDISFQNCTAKEDMLRLTAPQQWCHGNNKQEKMTLAQDTSEWGR